MITQIQRGQSITVNYWTNERVVFRVLNVEGYDIRVMSGTFTGTWHSTSYFIDIDMTEWVRTHPTASIRFVWGTNKWADATMSIKGASSPVIIPPTLTGLMIEPPSELYAAAGGSVVELRAEEEGFGYKADGGQWAAIVRDMPANAGFNSRLSIGKEEVVEIVGDQLTAKFVGTKEHLFMWQDIDQDERLVFTESRTPEPGDIIYFEGDPFDNVIDTVRDFIIIRTFYAREVCGQSVTLRWKSRTNGTTKQHAFLVRKLRFDTGDEMNVQRTNNIVEVLKSLRTSLLAFIPDLSIYSQWYYGDILQSSSVEMSVDGSQWSPVRVLSATQDINAGGAGRRQELQVEIVVREDDAV